MATTGWRRETAVAACLIALFTTTSQVQAAWYDAAWSSRKKITVDNTKVMATHTDFPLLVELTGDNDIKAARSDGFDFLFTDDDGTTKLDHEIEKWDDANGDLVAWVRIPSLPNGVDKDIYLYYDNSGASDQQNATGVWVNYVGVWHLNESSGTRADSTGNNNLTDQNTVGSAPGRMAGCADMEESSSERLYITDAAQTGLDITGNLTIQAWVKPESVPGSITFLDKYNGSNAGYRMRIHSNSWFEYSVYDGSTNEVRSNISADTGVWRFLVGVYDGSNVIIYTDNIDVDSTAHSGGINTNSEDFEIGARGNSNFYDGLIDEVRIATVARSAQWVETEFNMMDSPSTFATPSTEESGGGTGLVFNYLSGAPIDISPGTGSWVDVNVSAWVPSGATGVILEVKTESSSDLQYAVREKGSGDTWMWGPNTIKGDTQTWLMIGVDPSRVFQLRQASTSIDTYLMGYTMPGVTFFTTAKDKTPTAGSWQDVDISADTGPDTAIGAIFIIQNTGGSTSYGIRMKGSSDDRAGDLRTDMSTVHLIGVDASETCQLKIESGIKAYLVGYVTDGAGFFQNPINKSIAAGPTPIDVDITSHIGTDDANGALVALFASSGDRHQTQIRKNGATHDFDKWMSHQFAVTEIDTGDIFEGEVDDVAMEFWLVGYTLATPPVTVNYRSIGTNTGVIYSTGDATVSAGSKTVTFAGGASLPANVGQGDELVIGSDTLYIETKDSSTQVTVQQAASSAHTNAAYTIKRAYNTLQTWETARQGDLVADNRREVGVAYNDGDFTPGATVYIMGSTTDSTHYMKITAAEAHRHNGLPGTGVTVDAGGGFGGAIFSPRNDYTVLEWLEITNVTDGEDAVFICNATDVLGQNLLIHKLGTGTGWFMACAGTAILRNSIIYDGSGVGAYVANGNELTLENVTVYGISGWGVRALGGDTISVRNSISVGCTTDFDLAGTVDYFDYNMYSTTAGGFPTGANDKSPPADLDDLFFSIAASSEDLHIEDAGHDAVDTGLDLSSTFTTDIDADARTAPWDIGADEIMGAPLTVSSGQNQTFTVGDAATLISPVTVTDAEDTPVITATNDIRVRIPVGLDMTWDIFDVVATITGSASGKVLGTVSYEDSDKTLVIDVTSDFAVSESIAVSDLNFSNFGSVSSADSLELDINNDALADATDDKTITINAPPPPATTAVTSWQQVEPVGLGPPPPPPSTITFDNVTTDVSTTDRSSTSFSHTIGACGCCSDGILVVVCFTRGDQGCTGATYDGQTMIEVVNEQTSTSSGNEWLQIYYLTNPSTGTNTVAVTFGSSDSPSIVAAMSYFGVDQASPIGAIASASTTSSSSLVTVNITTTAENSVVVGGLGHHGGDTDPHAHGGDVTTEHYDVVSGTATGSDSGYAGGEIATTTAGLYTFEWTGNASDDWAIGCVELRPAP